MASNGSNRGRLLSAGGVLSIVAGIYQLILGGALIYVHLFPSAHCAFWPLIDALFLPFLPNAWQWYLLEGGSALSIYAPIWWVINGGCIGALGILAIVGGISARRRERFGLSLAGAICALPSHILGILAVIFVALGKREFGAKD